MVKFITDRGDFVSVLKKGSRYLAVYTAHACFQDILLFTTPVPLSKYLKQWGVSEQKSIFPYTLFSSIEDLNRQLEFPRYDQFYNELTDSNVDMQIYLETRQLYNYRRQLSADSTLKWHNFGDFLDYYNSLVIWL